MSAQRTAMRPQHLEALARANEVRLARAELKRRIGRGDVLVAELMLDTPWEAETMTVFDLLRSQRRWGETRCRRLLRAIPLSETKVVGTLTVRQRGAVADALREAGAPARSPRALALA